MTLSGRQLIEASAGTGKTHTITNLYLELLLGRGFARPLSVQEILVLTFTIAATQELKHRITSRITATYRAFFEPCDDDFIAELVSSSPDHISERKRLAAAMQLMDEASVFTIHGFCARVLGDQAFDAGTLFEQELSVDQEQILAQASEDVFRGTVMSLPPLSRDLARRNWPNPDALLTAFRPLLQQKAAILTPRERHIDIDADDLYRKIRDAKAGWLRNDIETLIRKAGFPANRKPMKHLAAMTDFCGDEDPDIFNEKWEIYSRASLEKSSKKNTRVPEDPVLDLIDDIQHHRSRLTELKDNIWHLLRSALNNRVGEIKRARHLITLDNLLTSLASALKRKDSDLARTLARRWPAIMVDEFQDTDEIQNSIFHEIFEAGEDHTLVMIGDPKQAIYQFRGADIHTYLNAREEASRVLNLDVNYRSSPPMVEATNHLFAQDPRFDTDGMITFPHVGPAPQNEGMSLGIDGTLPAPCQLLVCGDESAPMTATRGCKVAMEAAAEETARLLRGAEAGTVSIDGKPLTAGNIAFLVRRRADAASARAALNRRNLQSVYLTLDSVLLQDSAEDLKLVLKAVIEPTNEGAIKAALATRLMQGTADEIDQLDHDLNAQQAVLEEFQSYHDLWLRENVGPMIMALLHRRQLPEKWLGQKDGERQLTNLRHLIEILQARAAVAPGMHRLLRWFHREQQVATNLASEERQLRLESDENLIKIVTIHAAKGLEYDVVLIPYPFFSAGLRKNDAAFFHIREDNRYTLYAEVGDHEENRSRAKMERESEDMRLLYVALTRARYQCYLGLPIIHRRERISRSALGTLLGLDGYDPKQDSLLQYLAETLPAQLFCVRPGLETVTGMPDRRVERAGGNLPTLPRVDDAWRLHSYTGFARRLRRETPRGNPPDARSGYADDDPTHGDSGASISRFGLARGTKIGLALHTLMENADFTDRSRHAQLCRKFIEDAGIRDNREKWLGCIDRWLLDILETPLDNHDLVLGRLGHKDRVDEMEFHFPLNCAPETISFLTENGYLESATTPDLGLIEGVMTGVMDLVFRWQEKFYIVDYKSNHLGNGFGDYSRDRLAGRIRQHVYTLQYLIYTSALNRYLAATLTDYRYDSCFGGVYYLFLRGMNGKDNSTGVYFDRPPGDIIAGLDRLLGAR